MAKSNAEGIIKSLTPVAIVAGLTWLAVRSGLFQRASEGIGDVFGGVGSGVQGLGEGVGEIGRAAGDIAGDVADVAGHAARGAGKILDQAANLPENAFKFGEAIGDTAVQQFQRLPPNVRIALTNSPLPVFADVTKRVLGSRAVQSGVAAATTSPISVFFAARRANQATRIIVPDIGVSRPRQDPRTLASVPEPEQIFETVVSRGRGGGRPVIMKTKVSVPARMVQLKATSIKSAFFGLLARARSSRGR